MPARGRIHALTLAGVPRSPFDCRELPVQSFPDPRPWSHLPVKALLIRIRKKMKLRMHTSATNSSCMLQGTTHGCAQRFIYCRAAFTQTIDEGAAGRKAGAAEAQAVCGVGASASFRIEFFRSRLHGQGVALSELALMPVGISRRRCAGLVQRGYLFGGQSPAESAQVLAELLLVARADNER